MHKLPQFVVIIHVQGGQIYNNLQTGFKKNKEKPCASIKYHFLVTDNWVQKEQEKSCASIKNHFSVTDRFSRLQDNVQGYLPWGSLPTGFKRNNRKPCASIKDHFSVNDRFSRFRDNVQGPLPWQNLPTGFKRNKRQSWGSIKDHFSETDRFLRLLCLRCQSLLLVQVLQNVPDPRL